jgi:antitoxin component of RelBE/YafQ-DinJ toxin-antitoxin module
MPRTGRPPTRATSDDHTTLTIRIKGEVKNQLIDQADAFGLSVSEYIGVLAHRDPV